MKNNIIDIDFEGWPVKRRTLREILESIGAKEIETKDGEKVLGFPVDSKTLDVFPRTLEDDGMGYGVDEMWITGAHMPTEDIINMFREVDHFPDGIIPDDYYELG